MLFKGETILKGLFTIAELALTTATVLPFSRSARWWIRTFDFPRTQLALAGALVLGADVALRRDGGPAAQLVRGGLLLSILYQAYRIRPYTILAGNEVQGAKKTTP